MDDSMFDESRAIEPFLLEYINKAMMWAMNAPESHDILPLYVNNIDVILDGEVVGRIYTGDDVRFVPIKTP